jgi:hypothetical protein
LKVEGHGITLQLLPAGTFVETVLLSSGHVEKQTGTWLWASEGVNLNPLWIPEAFAPDYIRKADANASATGRPKYTMPGHWSVTPERNWEQWFFRFSRPLTSVSQELDRSLDAQGLPVNFVCRVEALTLLSKTVDRWM